VPSIYSHYVQYYGTYNSLPILTTWDYKKLFKDTGYSSVWDPVGRDYYDVYTDVLDIADDNNNFANTRIKASDLPFPFANIGVVKYAPKPNYVNQYSIITPLSNQTWRDGAQRFFADIGDNHLGELDSKSNLANILSQSISDLVTFFGLGTTNNQSQYQTLVAQNNNNGAFFDNSNLDTALTSMINSIVSQANAASTVETYLLQNDCLLYNTSYSDYENDPMYAQRWIITHNPSFYENNQGMISTSGQYVSSPITCFDKVGKYVIQYQGRDNAKNDNRFDNFRYWSLDTTSKMVVYVNRKPFARFIAKSDSSGNVTINDSSYDLDHFSQLNRGIQEWQWSWRQINATTWNSGQPSWLNPGDVYLIQLKVRDMENNWSDPYIQAISTGGVDLPPVALFEVNPSSTYLYGNFTLTDRSYDPDGQAITAHTWTIVKDGTQIYTGSTTPTSTNLRNWASASSVSNQGTYMLTEIVQDAGGLWSTPYSQNEELSIHGPAPSFTAPDIVTRDQVVTITNTTPSPDADGSLVNNFHWYAILNGTSNYDLGTATQPSNFTFKSLGLGKNAVSPNWQLKLVATDANGNSASAMQPIGVINQNPVASATGPNSGIVNQSYTFTSASYDPDSDDGSSLQYVFSLTSPSGQRQLFTISTITPTFTEGGNYTLEHYVVDQLNAKSNVFSMLIYIDPTMKPVPGFTISPSPAYRIDTVNINSTAYDTNPGGYISQYQYFLTPPGGSESLFTTNRNWPNTFNTLGLWTIRQFITNNKGQTAQISQQLTILNHPPTVTLTNPSSADINNPTGDAPPFMATWNYSDSENDVQSKYQVKIFQASNNALVKDSGIVSGNAITYAVPAGLLVNGQTYYMTVTAWDAYNAQSNTDTKYFITNRPPTGNITFSTPIYQNDSPTFTVNISDPDLDPIDTRVDISFNGGAYTTIQNWLALPSGTTKLFTYGPLNQGIYTMRLFLTDRWGANYTQTYSFTVLPLNIAGQVNHTPEWESYRQQWNVRFPASTRAANVFWAGEAFELSAQVTNTNTSTKPTNVSAQLIQTGDTAALTSSDFVNYTGEMLNTNFVHSLSNGTYTMRFTVTWNNGLIQNVDVPIIISGNIFDVIVDQLRG
jgi:hypothetical protein